MQPNIKYCIKNKQIVLTCLNAHMKFQYFSSKLVNQESINLKFISMSKFEKIDDIILQIPPLQFKEVIFSYLISGWTSFSGI